MSKLSGVNHSTYDYAWSQFVDSWHTNKLLDGLYNELSRLSSTVCKKQEYAEYEDDYESDDDD